MSTRLILIDGSSYLYRAFHALPNLSTRTGQPTGAIVGVLNMLKLILKEYEPTHIAVIFDAKGETFRHRLSPAYKAQRSEMPDTLTSQIPFIHKIIQALGLPLLMQPDVEADDVIATLATQAEQAEMETIIFTGDKDLAQLVNSRIILKDTLQNRHLDIEGVQKKFGVLPTQMLDYLCLIGDSSDNVQGVAKVGEKTAIKWLNEYKSLENLINHAHEITGKIGENLRAAIPETLPLAKQLIQLKKDVTLPYQPQQLQRHAVDVPTLQQLLTELEFKQHLTELIQEYPDLTTLPSNSAHSSPISRHYHTILTEPDFLDWLAKLEKCDLFAVDTETNSLNYLDAEIIGISFSYKLGEAIYIPLKHDYLGAPPQLNPAWVLEKLKPLLENPNYLKVGQNLKFDAHILANQGISLKGFHFDTLLASYVLDSTQRHDLDSLATRYLNEKTTSFTELAGKGKKQLTFNQIGIEEASAYACEDADITFRLYRHLSAELQAESTLQRIFLTTEMPLISVLLDMERHGVQIDAQHLRQHSHLLAENLQKLEEKIFSLVDERFNLNSPKQLQNILFNKLNLKVHKKTPTGEASTNEAVLEELAAQHPLPQLILEYRSLNKLKSTYTDALPKQINPRTQRVHTSYQQTGTVTGRLSSTEPNLQNIPIRTAEGRFIRQAFIAPKNFVLLSADYSQIELRIMAHLSGDAKLRNSFAAGADIHQATAAEVFNIDLTAVSPEQRRQAKATNFGLIYGMQAFGLAKQLGIERQTAQTFIDRYFERYPQVLTYMDVTRAIARERGYVETVWGRRLYITDIKDKNYQRRQYAERTAINAPLQGTAADFIRVAMIRVNEWIKNSGLPVQLIMQIHDELVLEIADDASVIAESVTMIRKIMSEVAELSVPLVVNIATGQNWDAAH